MGEPVNLPEGWREWPQEAKSRLLATVRAAVEDRSKRPFFVPCTYPDCDGMPHTGVPWKHARPAQLPVVGDWTTWLILAGRGFGKTRIGAEWSWRMARRFPRGALVAATAADARDTMVEGESGILACAPATFRPKYEPSKRRLTYPNGAIQTTFSADQPDRLRGPQHHYAWGDEWAAWRHMEEATDMLAFGLRLGEDPRVLYTTTPKPRKVLKEALADPATLVTRGSTYDNLPNLAKTFQTKILRKYEGTTLGAQELDAQILSDVAGALWTSDLLINSRRTFSPLEIAKDLARVVVAVDPAATHGPEADETGIVVVGVSATSRCPVCGPVADGPHGFVLDDLSGRYTPNGWAGRAVAAYERFSADRIIGETNNGGEMVESTVRTVSGTARYRGVHASRGKQARAEPVAALYEQGRVHTAPGLDLLEEQKRTWVPGETMDDGDSPDRLDAEVWGITDLMLETKGGFASAA